MATATNCNLQVNGSHCNKARLDKSSDDKDCGNNDNDNYNDDENFKVECGIGGFKPAALRMCTNMPTFTGFYSVSALMTSTLSFYVNSQVTTLEKHFGFSSSQTGMIMAANDIGFLCITLFVSFMAAKVHIPRALGAFTILFGLSGIVCALPYFMFGAPSPIISGDDGGGDVISNVSVMMTLPRPSSSGMSGQMCDGVNHTSRSCDVTQGPAPDASSDTDAAAPAESMAKMHAGTALVIIVMGMILQGIGKTPRSAFSTYYVDNNGDRLKTGFYMGVIITMAIMGPACAFGLGGLFSSIYVTLEDTDMHYRHPRWIGAWWLGYLTFGCAACVVALPLFLFPRSLRPQPPQHAHRPQSQGNTSGSVAHKKLSPGFESHIKDPNVGDTHPHPHVISGNVFSWLMHHVKGFLGTMIRLWTNPVYMCVILSACLLIFAGAGGQAFSPKYLENQFSFPAWKANMAMAGVMLGTACVGTFIGGYLSKRLKMGPMSALKFTLGMKAASVIFVAVHLAFKCDQPMLYNSPGPRASGETTVAGCMDQCACDDSDYFPVHSTDGRTFFSPCHAGCKSFAQGLYTNCTCIGGEGTAKAGMEDYSCAMFYPYIVNMCVSTLLIAVVIIPQMLIYLRAVEERDKALALGFNSFMTSITGWMLGPICFGKLIDGICIQWEHSCGDETGGACRLYDNDLFRWKLIGYQIIFHGASVLLMIVAIVVAKATGKFEDKKKIPSDDNDDDDDDARDKKDVMTMTPLNNGGGDHPSTDQNNVKQ